MGGLYCIEGTAIRSFKAGDGSKLLSDKIWALQEDRKGNIWIGFLDAGIQCLNPSDHSFQTIDLEKAGLMIIILFPCALPMKTIW